jgi:thiol-disulfide isomerase/thioredoxin
VAAAVLAGVYAWYVSHASQLPVNQSPTEFKLIETMEKEGAPDFELSTLDGKAYRLSQFKGKTVLLNFWASWCGPCVQEFPSMVRLAKEMAGQVVIVAVATDDERADVEAFVRAFAVPPEHFYVLWDKDKSVMRQYGVEKIPESFILRGDRTLIRKVLGIENWATPDALGYFRAMAQHKSKKT